VIIKTAAAVHFK